MEEKAAEMKQAAIKERSRDGETHEAVERSNDERTSIDESSSSTKETYTHEDQVNDATTDTTEKKTEANTESNDAHGSEQTTEQNDTGSESVQVSSEYKPMFSAAQVRVKMDQARLEAKMAGDEELLRLKKQIIELEYRLQNLTRKNEQAVEKYEALQKGLDDITKDHKRTLNGMRDNLQLETLVAALDVEKTAREKLQQSFEKQNAELLEAQNRVESLNAQILNYQKTETVLAQSISHFQHRFDAKDQQRVAALERAKFDLEDKYRAEIETLQRELEEFRQNEAKLLERLHSLEQEHNSLKENIKTNLEQQEKNKGQENELRAIITALETEKSVLVSKAEQWQKADAQLRSKVNAQNEELETLRQQNAQFQHEIKDLTDIATELLEQAEKRKRDLIRTAADEEILNKSKKRLRMSIG